MSNTFNKLQKDESDLQKTTRTDAVMASSNWPWHITSEMRKLERDYNLLVARYELLRDQVNDFHGIKI
jgi:hypothetical protein